MAAAELAREIPSALVVVVLGSLAAALARGSKRGDARRAFALFLAFVAANYALVAFSNALTPQGHPSDETRPPISHALLLAAEAIQIADPVALVVFAGRYAPGVISSRLVRGVVGAAAVSLLAILGARREVMYGDGASAWGFVVAAYVTATYALVLSSLLGRAFGRERGEPAVPFAFLVGFSIVALYRNLPSIETGLARSSLADSRGLAFVSGGIVLEATIAFLVYAFVAAVFFALHVPLAAPENRKDLARLLGVTLAISLLLSLVIHAGALVALAQGPLAPAPSSGIAGVATSVLAGSGFAARWLVFAATSAPTFLANRVFVLDSRVRRGLVASIVAGTLVLFAVVAAALVATLLADTTAFPARWVVLGAIVALGATGSLRLGRRAANALLPARPEQEEAYRRLRKLDAYRRALAAVAQGRASRSELDEMRRSLGLSREEEKLARAAADPGAARVRVGPGLLLARRYEIVRSLGRGGQGRLFVAKDRVEGELVAVKQLFQRWDSLPLEVESQILATSRIRHPRVIGVLDLIEERGEVFLVTRYVEGGSLEERFRDAETIGGPQALRIAEDVAAALEAAHAAGVLHRDVKPANVLVDRDGAAHLADFGVASIAGGIAATAASGDVGVAGTLAFLPPEAFEGGRADEAWDVFATGVLFEALSRHTAPGPERERIALVAARARAPLAAARWPSAAAIRRALRPVD